MCEVFTEKWGKQPMRKHKIKHTYNTDEKKKLSSAGVAQICQYSEFYRKYYKEKYIYQYTIIHNKNKH